MKVRLLLLFTVLLATNTYGTSSKLGPRVVGGRATTIEQHPYQVSVIYIDSHFCGGSVISPTYILTAAHCTSKISAEDLFVRAGSTVVNAGGQFRQVARIIQHPQYDAATYDYDISLLQLSESLTFGSTVAPIALPEQDEGDVSGDLEAIATGWGKLSQDGPLPLELQEVEIPTLDANDCEYVYGSSITERMICAGHIEGQKDTCRFKLEISNCFFLTTETCNKNIVQIVGGQHVTIEEYPYQVSLIYIDSHYCGGSIIHPQLVITAAHCTFDFQPEYILVRAGSTYLNQGGQVKEVAAIYNHPNYYNGSYDYDISIIKLVTPFSINQSVKTITLPLQDEAVQDNQIGVATGWGRLSTDGPLPLELQKVDLPTISDTKCQNYNNQLTENMFCAGFMEEGRDTCDGDSGGPYVINGILFGITSWGSTYCGAEKYPAVFTKVSAFRSYIDSIIKESMV